MKPSDCWTVARRQLPESAIRLASASPFQIRHRRSRPLRDQPLSRHGARPACLSDAELKPVGKPPRGILATGRWKALRVYLLSASTSTRRDSDRLVGCAPRGHRGGCVLSRHAAYRPTSIALGQRRHSVPHAGVFAAGTLHVRTTAETSERAGMESTVLKACSWDPCTPSSDSTGRRTPLSPIPSGTRMSAGRHPPVSPELWRLRPLRGSRGRSTTSRACRAVTPMSVGCRTRWRRPPIRSRRDAECMAGTGTLRFKADL